MAGMNYVGLYTEVGNEFSSQDVTRAKLWTLRAYHAILNRRAWSFLETTSAAVPLVASQAAYTLIGTSPVLTDFGGIIDVELELTSGNVRVPMYGVDQQVYDRVSAWSRVNGVPVMYTLAGGTPASTSATVTAGGQQVLAVWPFPLATAGNGVNFFIRYIRSAESVEMSADTDVPIIPVKHQWAIVELAKSFAYSAEGELFQANILRELAENTIQQMIAEDMRQRPPKDALRLEFVSVPRVGQIAPQQQAMMNDPASSPYPVPQS